MDVQQTTESVFRERFLQAKWTTHAMLRLRERFNCAPSFYMLERADWVGSVHRGLELWRSSSPDGAYLLFSVQECSIVTVLTHRHVKDTLRRELLMLRQALRMIRDGTVDSPRKFAAELLSKTKGAFHG